MRDFSRLRPRYDVVVLGSGLASLCLARQLTLQLPHLTVMTLDRSPGPFSRKVGESLVEIAAHYMHTVLELGEHLHAGELPKNGLRFFFDDSGRSLSLAEASEDGPATFSYWRTFQIERDRFEKALCDLNEGAGVDHVWNVTVAGVEPGGDCHTVRIRTGQSERAIRCRWLVDATGADTFLGRQLGRITVEERENHGACWGRFEGFRSPDDFLAEYDSGHRPICSPRLLSTSHLMHRGYWIWWIPLASGLMSVGSVYDRSLVREVPETAEEFEAFLRSHRMCAELMEGARLVDFGRMERMAYLLDRVYAADRTAWIGMASGFLDPFYSPGSDFITLKNECLVALMRAEAAGDGSFERLVETYNRLIGAFYEHAILYTRDHYRLFGSYELFVPKYRRDLHCYWNLFAWPYLSGQLVDPEFLEGYGPVLEQAHRRSTFFNRLFAGAAERLESEGKLLRRNRGEYSFNQLGFRMFPYINFERQMGSPVDPVLTGRLLDEIDRGTFLAVLDVLFECDRSPLRGLLYDAVDVDEVIDLEARHGLGDRFWIEVFAAMSRRFTSAVASKNFHPGIEITPETLGRLRGLLADSCGDDRVLAAELDRAYVQPPRLTQLEPLFMKEIVQPEHHAWDFSLTPWDLSRISWKTKYELLDEVRRVPAGANREDSPRNL